MTTEKTNQIAPADLFASLCWCYHQQRLAKPERVTIMMLRSANSWRKIVETVEMDMREVAKKWKTYKYVCFCYNINNNNNKKDHNEEQRPRSEKSPTR